MSWTLEMSGKRHLNKYVSVYDVIWMNNLQNVSCRQTYRFQLFTYEMM